MTLTGPNAFSVSQSVTDEALRCPAKSKRTAILL